MTGRSDRSEDAVVSAATLPALLHARAEATPDVEALRFGDRSLTCRELLRQVETVANRLQAQGVGAGDRVAVCLPNGIEFALVWLAVPLLRAVVVPVNVAYGSHDLTHVVHHSGASVVVCGPQKREAVESVRCEATAVKRVLDFDECGDDVDDAGALSVGDNASDWKHAEAGEPVTIQYTSGTTGLPKGCVLTHGYWLRIARTMQEYGNLTPYDVLLTAQPLSYMDPGWNLVLALCVGAPLVVLPRFSASSFWADVKAHGATFFYCIGTMPLYLLRQPPNPEIDRGHNVRLVYCSGIPAAMHQEFEERWGCPWREAYGTTELGVVTAVCPEDKASVGSGSMGHAVPGLQIRLVNDDGGEVAPGEPGELLVRGADTMLRYHEDAAATDEWCRDGWARTGDVVVSTPAGLSLVGRKKDMIRRAGENISAAEVESVSLSTSQYAPRPALPSRTPFAGRK